jgi:serine protease AprX
VLDKSRRGACENIDDVKREQMEQFLQGGPNRQHRLTHDIPIAPEVWFAYADDPASRIDLLLTPNSNVSSASELCIALRERLAADKAAEPDIWSRLHQSVLGSPSLLFNEAVVLAHFSFYELVRIALPLSEWWHSSIALRLRNFPVNDLVKLGFERWIDEPIPTGEPEVGNTQELESLIEIVGAMVWGTLHDALPDVLSDEEAKSAAVEVLRRLPPVKDGKRALSRLDYNRRVRTSVSQSRRTVKADAATNIFAITCKDIRWAILDNGIDATHPAFYRRDPNGKPMHPDANHSYEQFENSSRVVATYDFLRLKQLLDPDAPLPDKESAFSKMLPEKQTELREKLHDSLMAGRTVDWDLLEPFLRIPHDLATYSECKPKNSHGTVVAGILASDWREAVDDGEAREPLIGICPDIELYDIRVIGQEGDEFTVMAGLQFVRHLNRGEVMKVHGVNLSFSVPHDVRNYACGDTPVCQECERVVASGVVVVVPAGNRGFNSLPEPEGGALGDYRYISITDPGNAQSVITVGSTHRFMPHKYGVSYFSGRGPTGDGRFKPDLLAPGERIDGPSLDHRHETMDGTSMAVPHVSGAAALLMARNRDLVRQPLRVKDILCATATDLGRDRNFQGAGMLDVLRAIQSA